MQSMPILYLLCVAAFGLVVLRIPPRLYSAREKRRALAYAVAFSAVFVLARAL